MTLTPALKTIVITLASFITVLLWIWVGIKIDALALGLNEHVYNIGFVIITSFNTGGVGLLVYLGLRAPVAGERVVDE